MANVVVEAQGLPITSARAECAGGVTAGVVDAVGPVGYLAEGARTNMCLQSNTFNNASWTSTLGTLTQNTTGPDGAVSAWTATDNSAVAFLSVSQLLTIVNTTTYAHSIFVQKTSGATVFPVFEVGQGDGINYFGAVINTNTGVITAATGGAYVAPTSVSAHSIGDFWRVIIVGTSNGVTCRFSFYPAASSNGTTVGAASLTGSAVIYGAQLEAAAFASTYIPTTTVAVARNSDKDAYVATGNISPTAGTLVMTVQGIPATSNIATVLFDAQANAAADYIQLGVTTGGVGNVTLASGGVLQVNTNGTTDLRGTTKRKIAITWQANEVKLYVDGVQEGATDTSATMPVDLTSMTVGCYSSAGYEVYGALKDIKIYPRAFSAAQVAAL